jgi:hypothetical protein
MLPTAPWAFMVGKRRITARQESRKLAWNYLGKKVYLGTIKKRPAPEENNDTALSHKRPKPEESTPLSDPQAVITPKKAAKTTITSQPSVYISSPLLSHPAAAGQEQQDPSPANVPTAAHAVATSHPPSLSLQQRGPRSDDQETTSIAPQLRTGRPPLLLYSQTDDATLSVYQCLIRQQIEIFEATEDDVQFNISKMSNSIVLGQVGIRCRRCAILAQYARPKAAVYYPRTLDSLYQCGQNMLKNHLCAACQSIAQCTKQTLVILQEDRKRGKGGRDRWAEAAREMNIVEDQHGLRFG